MKAIEVRQLGGPEVLTLVDIPIPQPKPHEFSVSLCLCARCLPLSNQGKKILLK